MCQLNSCVCIQLTDMCAFQVLISFLLYILCAVCQRQVTANTVYGMCKVSRLFPILSLSLSLSLSLLLSLPLSPSLCLSLFSPPPSLICLFCSYFRRGCYCPVCLKVYHNDETDGPMVCCDSCDKWIHIGKYLLLIFSEHIVCPNYKTQCSMLCTIPDISIDTQCHVNLILRLCTGALKWPWTEAISTVGLPSLASQHPLSLSYSLC